MRKNGFIIKEQFSDVLSILKNVGFISIHWQISVTPDSKRVYEVVCINQLLHKDFFPQG